MSSGTSWRRGTRSSNQSPIASTPARVTGRITLSAGKSWCTRATDVRRKMDRQTSNGSQPRPRASVTGTTVPLVTRGSYPRLVAHLTQRGKGRAQTPDQVQREKRERQGGAPRVALHGQPRHRVHGQANERGSQREEQPRGARRLYSRSERRGEHHQTKVDDGARPGQLGNGVELLSEADLATHEQPPDVPPEHGQL